MSRASLPKVDGEEALRRDSHTSRSQEAPLRIIDVEVAEAAPAARRVAAGPRLHTGTPGLRARAQAPGCSPGRARLLPARAAASSLQAASPPVPLPLRSFRNRHLQRNWVVRLKVDELRWHYVSSADLAHQAHLRLQNMPICKHIGILEQAVRTIKTWPDYCTCVYLQPVFLQMQA